VLGVTRYPDFEFVIVDNGSEKPETREYLAGLQSDSRFQIVRDPSPFNYSALNNRGAYYANGEVLGLLNNDVEIIDPDWMERLVAHAIRPEIGAVGAKLLYPDRTVQHAGMVVGLSNIYALHSFIGLSESDPGYQGRASLDQWITCVTGACLFIRKSVFEELGGLDSEAFAVTYNDVDLCLKARRAGYHNVYAGGVSCIHHESKSRGSDDTEEKRRGHQWAMARCATRWGAGYEDPYYHPSLELSHPNFSLSFMPRRHKLWFR
jgi:GT2 family glycosyltransferase